MIIFKSIFNCIKFGADLGNRKNIPKEREPVIQHTQRRMTGKGIQLRA